MKEKSHAKAAGLKLGDSIVTINGKDTSKMTLKEANDLLEQVSKQDVKLGITKWVYSSRVCIFSCFKNRISIVNTHQIFICLGKIAEC